MTGLTAELVVDACAPQTPALAPNGQLLCYVLAPISRTGEHFDTELWLVDTDGAAASRRATTDTAAVSRPRWSADSGTLFFLSDRADRGTSQVHRLTLADGAATAVTDWDAGIIDHLTGLEPGPLDRSWTGAACRMAVRRSRSVRHRLCCRGHGQRCRTGAAQRRSRRAARAPMEH